MLNWLKERQLRTRTARELYGSIVTQARQSTFYDTFGVPDTPRGRFEVIVLHMAILIGRLQAEGPAEVALARAVGEVFVTDMDDNMRELSFSDLAVPREVKKVAAAVYDRHAALSAALADSSGGPGALEASLRRDLAYLSKDATPDIGYARLAAYARAAVAALKGQPLSEITTKMPAWPAPSAF